MVVLVRRFDPSGEMTSRWEPLYRDEDGVAFFSRDDAKRAALDPPENAELHVGDLIAVVPAEAVVSIDERAVALYVVAPHRVKAAPALRRDIGRSWLSLWASGGSRMILASECADRRRGVMAACSCSRSMATHLEPYGRAWSLALETTEAWCAGRASLIDVARAAEAPEAALRGRLQSIPRGAAEFAALAVIYAARAPAEAGLQSVEASVNYAETAFREQFDASVDESHTALAPLVERWIPLPVVLLSILGHPDAIPFDPGTV